MIRVRLRGINKVRKRLADGTRRVYFYHRATGLRLEGAPGSPEFVASWQAAEAQVPDANRHKDTFAEIMNRYRASDNFTELSPTTKRDYLKQIAKIEAEFGDLPIKALRDPRIKSDFLDWRDRLAETSRRQADYAMTVLGVICKWAVNRGVLANNPAANPGRKYQADRSEKIWTGDQVAAFLKVASPELQLAMMLALETAQRQGDLLRLSWTAYDGNWIRLRQSKTGAKVEIPVTAELKPWLEAAPRRATTILTTADGKPWKADNFRHHWREATLAAGCDGLTFHDLRGTAITQLFDAGCNTVQVASISGHSQRSAAPMMDVYKARTSTQAQAAIVKLGKHRAGEAANRTRKPAAAGSRKGGAK